MDEQMLTRFSKLLTVLHSACQATNTTCKFLQKSCFDHRNVLKTWVLPADKEDEVYECTCHHSTGFDEPVELVNDIVSVVERAQAARKRVTTVGSIHFRNSSKMVDTSHKLISLKEKQKEKMCSSDNGRTNKVQVRRSEGSENSAAKIETSGTRNLCSSNNGRTNKVQVRRSEGSENSAAKIESSGTRNLFKKGSNTKVNKSRMFQTTYQKDFSQRNSRLLTQSSKHSVKISKNLDLVSTRLDEVETSLDVDSLLERVVIDVPVRKRDDPKTEYAHQVGKDNECMVHSKVVRPVVHRNLPLKDAIDLLGVPSELLKLLKTYHHYINHDAKCQFKITKKSYRDIFLGKLNVSNQNSWHSVSMESIVELLLQFLHVYVEIISISNGDINTTLIENLAEEFDILSKNYHKMLDKDTNFSDDALSTKRVDSSQYEGVIEDWNWALAGIWNRQCWSMFSDFKDTVKISYGNSNDCKILQKKFQEIQKLQLQIEILDILQNDVFPLINNLHDDHVALASLYKCCSALCNISSLRVPTLLRI